MLNEMHTPFDYGDFDPSPVAKLTPRQTIVAMLLGAGYSLENIAKHLSISTAGVRRHFQALKRYWGVKTDAQLIARIVRSQMDQDRSAAQFLFEEILPALTGAEIIAPFLHERDWCGFAVRLPNGQIKRVWLLNDMLGDHSGWVRID